MNSAVVVFPGSNCDRDCAVAIERSTGERPQMVWHGESTLPDRLDLIVLPGGFSYGDYLRCGAMAALSPVMAAVKDAANRGVAVVGVCNGFQVLCEAGMLPGALLRNAALKYVCKPVALRVETAATRFTSGFGERREAVMTVGNGEGNYFADEDTLDRLEGEGQVGVPLPRQPQRLQPRRRRDHQRPRQRGWASCPTQTGPSSRSWARRTARCCSRASPRMHRPQ